MSPQRTAIVQLPDPPALARRACEHVLRTASEALAARGVFRIALSGGSTPALLYRELAQAPGADFARWHVYFGDERAVPPDHADSNYRMAREAWLGRGQVPEAQIHRIRGELDAAKAAAEYERELVASFGTREAPRFDLALLGLGSDGHTASLFPGTTALREARLYVASTWVERLSTQRITLTLRTLNAARNVLFLVAGADKASTLRAVLHGGPEAAELPARMIKPWEGSLTWMIDSAAATGLVAD